MAPLKTNTLLTVDLILLLLNVSLCIIFTNGKAEIPPASKIAPEILEEEVHPIFAWNHLTHSKDEILNHRLVKLTNGAEVEHRVDRTDGVPPFALVPNSCLKRTFL